MKPTVNALESTLGTFMTDVDLNDLNGETWRVI